MHRRMRVGGILFRLGLLVLLAAIIGPTLVIMLRDARSALFLSGLGLVLVGILFTRTKRDSQLLEVVESDA